MIGGMHQPCDPDDFTIEEILVVSELFEKHTGRKSGTELDITEKLVRLGAKLHKAMEQHNHKRVWDLLSTKLVSSN